MSDAARAQAESLQHGDCVHAQGTTPSECRDCLSWALDAYAAEQTAALRALVERGVLEAFRVEMIGSKGNQRALTAAINDLATWREQAALLADAGPVGEEGRAKEELVAKVLEWNRCICNVNWEDCEYLVGIVHALGPVRRAVEKARSMMTAPPSGSDASNLNTEGRRT